MKKTLIVLMGIILLSGCSNTTDRLDSSSIFTQVLCDEKYGVEYIIRPYAITLRVSRDGTPVTCEMEGE
jgi:uncharacterized protein YceK